MFAINDINSPLTYLASGTSEGRGEEQYFSEDARKPMRGKSKTRAKRASTGLTMAIGDSGHVEPCPVRHAVEVEAVPGEYSDAGMLVIPATQRWMSGMKGEDPTALKLLRIRLRTKERQYVSVEYRVAPFERYRLGEKRVMGTQTSCAVRNEQDLADPIFSKLTESERNRIRIAMTKAKSGLPHSQ